MNQTWNYLLGIVFKGVFKYYIIMFGGGGLSQNDDVLNFEGEGSESWNIEQVLL